MTHTIVKTTNLHNTQGGSDKVYNVFLIDNGDGTYDVNATWGRRGNSLTEGQKAHSVSRYAANETFDKLVKSKMSGGYKDITASVPANSGSMSASRLNQTQEEIINEVLGVGSIEPEDDRDTGLYPMLLNPIDEEGLPIFLASTDWMMQEKLDGKRIMAQVAFGWAQASNRKGQKVAIPDEVFLELKQFDDCILDGELVGTTYYVFDVLEYAGENLRNKTCEERFWILCEKVIGDNMLDHIELVSTAFTHEDKTQMVADLRHKEGVVLKRCNSAYVPGRPGKGGDQLKCKFWESCSCLVTKLNDKRSISVSVVDEYGIQVNVGNVTVPPNYELPTPGSIVEVKYLYFYPGGSLYQPIYLGERDDVGVDKLDTLKPKSTEGEEE